MIRRSVWQLVEISALLLFVVSVLFSNNVFADGMIIIERPIPMPPNPIVPRVLTPLAIKYHHVNVKISGQTAVTEVDQSFYNPNDQRLEGTYMFPIPKGANINKFSLDINGTMTDAELLDANKAREIYEDIVRRMKDPALLEYAGQGMFKLRIFPIEPHSEKKIRLKYTQLLSSESGTVGYLYPLNTEKFSSQPLESVAVKVDLESNQPLTSIYSPSHTVEVNRHGDNNATVGYEAKNLKPDTDFQLFFSHNEKEDLGITLLTYNEGGDKDGGYFILLASPSAQMRNEKAADKDVVFVVDTSGSMADGGKIEQAKRALQFCVQNLNSGDRFEIVRFSTESETLFSGLVEVNESNRKRAADFISSLKPIGGTAIEDALLKSLNPLKSQAGSARPYLVVFLTDGMPTIGTTNDEEIVTKVSKETSGEGVRIFTFGVGTDVNTHLLDKLAEKTRAASQYVFPNENMEIKISSFYSKINDPVLSSPKIKLSGSVTISKLQPAELPDLFKGDQLVVMGRYAGSGGAAFTIEGMVNGGTRTYTYEGTFPEKETNNAFIPQLWATRRVGYLLDQIRLNGESKELRDEVTELARRYGIITPYTAYLVVEDERRRDIPVPQQVLSSMGRDAEFKERSKGMYDEVKAEKSGYAALGGAQALRVLSKADSAAAPASANAFARKGQVGSAEAGADKLQSMIQNQRQRNIGSRTFYQNGRTWIDSQVQSQKGAKNVQVKFGSEDYFSLLKKHPETAKWLALGTNVTFLLNDTIYEVID